MMKHFLVLNQDNLKQLIKHYTKAIVIFGSRYCGSCRLLVKEQLEIIAQKYPKISNQSIMISMRNLDLIAFLDLETEKITWAFLGPWRGQHSTKFLENGNIIMLDNQGNAAEGGPSRILEINMDNLAIEWEYTGTKDTPFHTPYNGMIDILPNGNILISETHSGRIFEVNKDDVFSNIIWSIVCLFSGSQSR